MLTAVVTSSGSAVEVTLLGDAFVAAEAEEGEGPENDLNPIFPELKEVVWGFGAFVVLALAMRLFLFRRVRDGMTARYDSIQGDRDQAVALTASARSDVADYEAQVAAARAEAQTRVESARATLEAERTAKLADANARIAEKRAAAAADVEAARTAASSQVEAAVAQVAARAGELAVGRAPSDAAVSAAVTAAMSQTVSS